MFKVSIIIPVYNVEKYLVRCLESCVRQTLQDIEIIAVDDCSTDNSRNILRDYEEKFNNFSVVYLEKNIRQGGARNVGIRMARGEYLLFLDSDDWIEPNTCELLYEAADGADMVGANHYISTDTTDKKTELQYKNSDVGRMNHDKLLKYTRTCGFFWSRIYSKEFLMKNNIFFPEGIYYEDAYFNFFTALYSEKIVKIEECFYHYYQREGSVIHSRNEPHQYERIKIADLILLTCKEKRLYEKYRDIIDTKYIHMMASMVQTCLCAFDKPDAEQLKRIRNGIRDNYKNYQQVLGYKLLPKDLKLYFDWCMHSPRLAIFMHKSNIYSYLLAVKRRIKSIIHKRKD